MSDLTLSRFFERYRISSLTSQDSSLMASSVSSEYLAFMNRAAGATFNAGIYRVHNARSGNDADQVVGEAFPAYKQRLRCFAFDWLGRQFSLDFDRLRDGEPLVLIFEPGTGEVLEVPCTFLEFHAVELVDFAGSAVLAEVFDEWRQDNSSSLPLAFDQCVGFGRPLFLGGEDEFENYEVFDIDVYWRICGQLLAGTRDLPVGTRINQIVIE